MVPEVLRGDDDITGSIKRVTYSIVLVIPDIDIVHLVIDDNGHERVFFFVLLIFLI